MKRIKSVVVFALLVFAVNLVEAQDESLILDRVVAVVGDFHILQSDIEEQYLQTKMSNPYVSEDLRCDILDYFIEQKLMMTQAKIDSIEVSPGQVEQSMQARLNMFISQFGSEEEMEEYFNKSIYDIKDDLTKTMKEMMITQQVQQAIVGEIAITPSEVKSFYKKIPKDSIPYIDSEVKVAQILMYPPVDKDAEFEVRERLLELRKRIIDGENMSTLAILYSDDPSARQNFGEIGFRSKNELDDAYVDAAWALKEGQVSKIVKSGFGYHIIQSIERKGDRVNSRHILLQPKVDANAKARAISRLDSLRTFIMDDSLSFNYAAKYYSEDEYTRANGGLIVNPNNQAATFPLDQLDKTDYYTIREMEIGNISAPYETVDRNGKQCYKMIKLLDRSEPHKANLKDDYLFLQNIALNEKQNEVMQEWYEAKKEKTYIKIDNSFKICENPGE